MSAIEMNRIEMIRNVKPSRQEFCQRAENSRLVALQAELNLDLDTPVSIYLKLAGERRGFLLESVDTTQQKFGRYSFIGAEPFARLQVFPERLLIQENGRMKCIDGDPVSSITKYMEEFQIEEEGDFPLAHGGMVGCFHYEVAATFDRIRNRKLTEDDLLGQFMICRILIAYDTLKNSAQLVLLSDLAGQDAGEAYDRTCEEMQQIAHRLLAPYPKNMQEKMMMGKKGERLDLVKRFSDAPQEFLDAVRKAKEHIFAGDIFQVVPSCQFSLRITQEPFSFYRRLRQVNPSPYMFYLNFGEMQLVGASPEMLVKLSQGEITTYPIAGTRRRGRNEEEDESLVLELLADEKECAEHAMLVDLARNDLGKIAKPGSVIVKKLQVVEKFSHVMHIVSEVAGQKKDGYVPMDVLRATFPTGTVSGAPKLRAMEIICDLEQKKRESYAGTVGYMDFFGNMDMCITLRTMRVEKDRAFIQAGAGIVADSDPVKEYQEILQKARALMEVVEEVENHVVAF